MMDGLLLPRRRSHKDTAVEIAMPTLEIPDEIG